MQLELKDLTKKYGNFTALDHMTITFTPGIYGILGANGAGKSTMMNLLTDNISRTGGQILFDGTDILKLGKDFRRVLGYMPQQQGFYEHMTAQTFLYYMAELKGIPKKQAAQEIDALLEVTNLTKVRHKKMVGIGAPGELVESVANKVKEMPCPPEELERVQEQYKVGNIFQRRGETWVRVIGDNLPPEGEYAEDHLSLEDVYLYYLGE